MQPKALTNTPLEFLLAGSDIALEVLYLAPGEHMPVSLPAHDAVFVAVAHSETALPLLAALQSAAPLCATHLTNLPGRIPRTARTEAFKMLQGAPGIHIPKTARVSRSELLGIAADATALRNFLVEAAFPIIVRPVDSHAGLGLEQIEAANQLPAYVHGKLADEFFISPFIDYRGPDGMFRKYRVVLVDGAAYPGHMGVSAHWMIHYLNAGMSESAAKRREEERFMGDFRTGFGARHAAALDAIATRFGLDYFVIDCGETAAGDLFVFEVCTGAVVHAMDPVNLFAYKRPHMDNIFRAFRSLVIRSDDARRGAP